MAVTKIYVVCVDNLIISTCNAVLNIRTTVRVLTGNVSTIHHALAAAADFDQAEEINKGADSVDGVEATIWQVGGDAAGGGAGEDARASQERQAPSDIGQAAGRPTPTASLFGFPSRFGMMAAQMKALFDSTGGLWQTQALAGKPAGFFFSLGTQGGGRAGGDGAHGRVAAHAPRHGVRARRVHVRRQHVRHGRELVMPLKARLADEYLNGDAMGRKIRHTTNAPRVCIGEEK
ncbi:unnamed protein product [Miscanthus lutarioriparius]|uniref:NAD(P)H dehydrogenase (quinone) n=1 Tax=Miscanthus lutarioriparius TaxID=422564 RepID=A0A811Q5B9_9POAL|nr:unnamed protein product [Miscanthus lutarioriparius]